MTLYFDTKVEFLDSDAVSTIGRWHPNASLFAVASYSQERGGSVTIFSDSGEPQRDVTYPVHSVSQATSLAWHPEKLLLATGWENGDIYVWFDGHREFSSVQGPHKAPIILLEFSEKGGRMVTADSMGLLTGWRCDGQYQFLTMYSHDLRDVLLHITFRITVESEIREEMASLAKAAVAGDENALDALTNWRPRTAARNLTHSGVKDNHCFFVGTQAGIMFYLNQGGSCTEVLKNNTVPITQILWHPKKDAVVCLMEDMTITHFLVESTGILTELDRVKLSGKIPGNNGFISWAGKSIAIITGDLTVRIWDIEKSDNFLLKMELPSLSPLSSQKRLKASIGYNSESETPTTPNKIYSNSSTYQKQYQLTNEIFTCLAYCPNNQILCAGTNQGNLYTWKKTVSYFVSTPENAWQLTNISAVRGAIKQCFWGMNDFAKPCIMVNCVSNVFVLKEQPLILFHTRDIWAVQRNAKQIFLEHSNGKSTLVNTEFPVTALALNQNNLVLSNGREISTYRIEKVEKPIGESETTRRTTNDAKGKDATLTVSHIQTFKSECLALFIQHSNIFCLTSYDVIIYSVGGVILNKIQTNNNEGKIIGLDLSSHYLTLFTMNGYIKAYDVERHDPKLMFPARSGYDLFGDFGEVISAKCNCSGTHLAIIIANQSLIPDGMLHIWDFERNVLMHYDYYDRDGCNDDSNSKLPVSFCWDTDERRLLAVEIRSAIQQQKQELKESHKLQKQSSHTLENLASHYMETQAYIMFYSDKGSKINVLEILSLSSGEQLVNLCAPNVITLEISAIKKRSLQDFIDLTDCDETTRKMVLNFSLNVAEENMDLAYRCIRSIQSKVVWTNLAKMCVKTCRLDVAKVCMGHLEKARSVRAVCHAIECDDLENEAKVAMLATELGMIDKSKELYTSCGRLDLLNKLLQSSGKIDEAIQIAESGDRIHLKNTYFQKGKLLKENGEIKGALEYFEKTQNPVQNITQMLLEDPVALKMYMQNTKDSNMLKWWGQYVESSGDMDAALGIYQKAEDWFSQVKVLCYLGQISKADSIARQSGNRAACYHLARHYENIGKNQEAIMFYTRAQTYSNAIRICKENDYQDELWSVASSARPRDKTTAAAYFEECGSYKRAVELYHRAGMLHKALQMAFESEQPDILEVIASELTADSDPELINRCAEFFTNIEQHQKAVQLLAKTKQLKRAIQICIEKGVPITDTLAEMLTPTKAEVDEVTRIFILTNLGELLQQQGDYHTATKKFTQAGDKVRAMKSLLKSGNTDKIVFFANMSRQREVYIMAANYLQALNWQENPMVLKNIVTFYSKGQAYDSLANFYATCAQVEIDEYHDYEKALKAMHEAANCLLKIRHSQQALDNLQRTIGDVKFILDLQNSLKLGETQAVITGCRKILGKQELPPIRHADVLAMLVRALTFSKQYIEAGRSLKELAMKDSSWSSRGFLDKLMVQKIANECNLDFNIIWNSGKLKINAIPIDENEDEIQEEL